MFFNGTQNYINYAVFLAIVLCSAFCSYGKDITYDDYLKLSDKKISRAVKRLVKKEGGYYTVKQGRYYVHTDISPEKALQIAILMDDFQNRFSKVFRGSFKISRQAQVYLLGSKESYAKSLSEYSSGRIDAGWSAGMYTYRGSKGALFGDGSYGDEEVINIFFHEGTHQLLHYYLARNNIPVWFNEGMATNFESWSLNRSPENNRANAIYVSRRPLLLKEIYPDNGFVPFSRLIDISSEEWLSSSNPHNNYSSAWVACNFFLSSSDGREFLNILIRKLRSSSKNINLENDLVKKIELKINEYVEQVLVPHIKYTRAIKDWLLDKDFSSVKSLLDRMAEEYPDNREYLFYKFWYEVEQGNADDTMIKSILELEGNDFEDPCLYLTLAKAYKITGDIDKARKYAKDALEANSKDEDAEEFLEQLKNANN